MGIISAKHVPVMSLELMQQIHEKEFALMNEIDELADGVGKGLNDWGALEAKLDEYIAHVKMHFEEEEELMEEYDFHHYDMHKMAHDMFMADLSYAARQWKAFGDIERIVSFVRKAPEWVMDHITKVDTPTAEYLEPRIKGLK